MACQDAVCEGDGAIRRFCLVCFSLARCPQPGLILELFSRLSIFVNRLQFLRGRDIRISHVRPDKRDSFFYKWDNRQSDRNVRSCSEYDGTQPLYW